jgi:DNA repair protein RecN (Recombination protein N)
MPNVRFNIQVTSAATYFNNGKDELQFLFSANKGTDFGIKKSSSVVRCPECLL